MLMWIVIISLLLVGLTLIIVELIFIPGTTVVGLLGLMFSIVGIGISYRNFGSTIGFYVLTGALTVSLAALILSFKSDAWTKFSLKSSMDNKVNEGLVATINVGDIGTTLSTLRPIGKAEFNQKTYEVKTSGNYVNSGESVQITQIESHQIVVEPLKK